MVVWWDITSLTATTSGYQATEISDIPHDNIISTQISSKILISVTCSLLTRYYNSYPYWNGFGDVVRVRILNYLCFGDGK